MVDMKITTLLEMLRIGQPKAPSAEVRNTLNLGAVTTVSNTEQKALIERTFVPNNNRDVKLEELFNAVQPIHEDIATRKYDNAQMKALAPEIEQASMIMVPSILSPNDLQDNTLTFAAWSDKLSDQAMSDINTVLTEYFSNHLDLNKKLGEWLDTIMYGSGAKPILLLPELYISSLIKQELVASNEDFSALESYITDNTLFSGNTTSFPDIKDITLDDEDYLELFNGIDAGIEALDPGRVKQEYTAYKTGVDSAIEIIGDELTDKSLLTIHEDPAVVGLCELRKKYDKRKREAKISKLVHKFSDVKFTQEQVITLDNLTYNDDDEIGHPFMMELPTESVIPIHTPGSPNDHIGYFIMLDKEGNPVNSSEEPNRDKASILKSSFHAMFTSKSMENLTMVNQGGSADSTIMKVYEHMLDKYIGRYLENMEISNVDISKNQHIYKCMFSRFLAKKKTKLVFVPKELLIYYRFQHNDDGTGKSKLDDIKFVLSLRITLMVSRIMAAVDEAVVRQKLNLNFDESVANPLELMKKIKSRVIDNKIMNFTYNPSQIVKSITDRGLTVNPSNIPGITDFSIESEDGSRTKQRPDSDLMDDLDNMYTLALGPPPSSFNNLSETEYSRSIATTNLFFSKQIRNYQGLVCKYTSELAKTYISFSAPLKNHLSEIINTDLSGKNKDDATPDEDGTVTVQDQQVSEILSTIIESVSAKLPPPNIAPDKAQFEEFREYNEIIDLVVEALYGEELLGRDRDAGEDLNMIKSHVKRGIIKEYLASSGFGNSLQLPDIDTIHTTDITKLYQFVLNFRKDFNNKSNKFGSD